MSQLNDVVVRVPSSAGAYNYLGVVVGFAVFAAGYSCMRHLMTDKTIRLKRQNRAADDIAHEASGEHH